MVSAPNRRLDLDRAKGMAILFVVFGHIVARADPQNVFWYEPVRRAIYTFHMPFFLYLSGIAAAFSGALFLPPEKWPALARSRCRRLLVPFLLLGTAIVLGKCLAARFIFVDNRPAGVAPGLENLFWHTAKSPAISVWYLFVLFVLSVVAPVLVRAGHGGMRWLLAFMLLLYFLPLPQYVYLDHISRYAVYFAIGAYAGSRDTGWTRFVDRSWHPCLAVFAAALAGVACFGAGVPEKIFLLPIGLISLPALHGLVRNAALASAPVFLWLGRNSFMIYLFNTICIGLVKGVLLRVTSWDGSHFLPFAVVLMLSGCLGPILLRRAVFQPIGLSMR